MQNRLTSIYFSPTGGTKQAVTCLAESFTDFELKYIDYTLYKNRLNKISFTAEDVVIIGAPVYAGQLPQIPGILDNLQGNNTPCVIMACYGNRAYDDTLAQMQYILEHQGFKVIGAAGVIIPHIFSDKLGTNRPNAEDKAALADFAKAIIEKLQNNDLSAVQVPGNATPELKKPIFVPKAFDDSKCIMCGVCIALCPINSISIEHMEGDTNICISCMRCVKYCRANARTFNNDKITSWLEANFTEPKKIECFK